MDDLVTRLRKRTSPQFSWTDSTNITVYTNVDADCQEAAAEIDRLTAALADAERRGFECGYDAGVIASSAAIAAMEPDNG